MLVLLAFIAAVPALIWLWLLCLLTDNVKAVAIVPDDGGQLSDRLRTWITTRRGSRAKRAFRLAVRGFGSLMAGIGVLICMVAGGAMFMNVTRMPGAPGFLSTAFVLGIVGVILAVMGKTLSMSRASDILDPDGPRPILLLRSFKDDGIQLPHAEGNVLEQNFNPLNLFNTFEETLAATFKSVGPVVAVGRPGEPARPFGAARAYLSDEEWKQWVADFLEWSQLVVMLLGSPVVGRREADGLTWEILRVYRSAAPQKIILLIPPNLSDEEVRSRWGLYSRLVGGRFPLYQPGAVLIRYDADWTATVVSDPKLRTRGDERRFEAYTSAIVCARDWTDPLSGFEVVKSVTFRDKWNDSDEGKWQRPWAT
jgi:hypothetical protein